MLGHEGVHTLDSGEIIHIEYCVATNVAGLGGQIKLLVWVAPF